MDAEGRTPVGLADVLVALGVTAAVVLVAQVADPEARANLVSQPALRSLLCSDDAAIEVQTSGTGGRLKVPEGGLLVSVTSAGEPVASHLTLFRRVGTSEWWEAWSLEAPQGREVFYVTHVDAGHEAYVLAEPYDEARCPVRSATLRADA
ncbi:MAG TPA: hypothetical protein VNX21_09380 [Candidatus Thermoplasmatota archaeon]|nr:hypothetical protein [Candidatus Thermoplasmatota archaeon]